MLKTISGKFSLELIFSLDLSGQGLNDIDALEGCENLMLLNISKNNIKDLYPLYKLQQVAFLNAA
jgi:Leucine-rich repeat (LRR) protein